LSVFAARCRSVASPVGFLRGEYQKGLPATRQTSDLSGISLLELVSDRAPGGFRESLDELRRRPGFETELITRSRRGGDGRIRRELVVWTTEPEPLTYASRRTSLQPPIPSATAA